MTKTFTFLTLSSFIFMASQAQETIQKVIYHEYDKKQITAPSQQQLNDLIHQLKNLPVISVSVMSYADKSGTSEYNRRLSEQRSLSVLKTLQAQLRGNITYNVNHFGEDHLLSTNDNNQAKNRRSIIIVTYKKEESKVVADEKQIIELSPYWEDVEEQHYNINLDDSVFITGKDGTQIRFAPGTILNKTGEPVAGQATMLLKEYYQPGDILLSGTHSESGNGLLQTSGMFKLVIIQNGDTLAKETRKPVEIKIPDKNNLSGRMNVFTMNHGDTGLWNDTKEIFSYKKGFWSWPTNSGKLKEFFFDYDLPFLRWPIGRKWSDEYHVSSYLFDFLEKRSNRTLTKYVKYTLTKKDSQTLTVEVSEQLRNRGVKQYNTKTFDTTYEVDYIPPYYETSFSNLSFINCDQFLNAPVRTNFYVKTPDCKGTHLLVYFKSLNAFMSVPYSHGRYVVRNVPPKEKVVLFAVGKAGDEIYCGKKEFTISSNASTELLVQKTKYEVLKKMLQEVAYSK